MSSSKAAPWGASEKQTWLAQQQVQRSYFEDILPRIQALSSNWQVQQYGELDYPNQLFPLFLIKSAELDLQKPTILITGGVHGYETSGVMGALSFAEQHAAQYQGHFNLIIAPCVSPWGYQTINRWNPHCVDPNRSFTPNSPAAESQQVMDAVAALELPILAHFDLHETTDTDNTVFRPALAARDAITQSNWDIPDGFYTVTDKENHQLDFQKAVIDSVKQVTHIAPSDANQQIIGETILSEGVIAYPLKKLGLCSNFTDAKYTTTTEVYPDSPQATPSQCIAAQVAAVRGGLDFLIDQSAKA